FQSLFLSHSSRAPPHLHSFPTRRSSDLPRTARVLLGRVRAPGGQGPAPAAAGHRVRAGRLSCVPAARLQGPYRHLRVAHGQRARSEEHTSELQSRENLVCRLLLEKKKKT